MSKILYIQFNSVKWYACQRCQRYLYAMHTVYCTLNDMHVEDVGDDKNTYYVDF